MKNNRSTLLEMKRMQKLAGLIKENEDFSAMQQEAEGGESPEQAAKEVAKAIPQLEKSPIIQKIADQIAKDPKAMEQLKSVLGKAGINPDQLSEGGVDSDIVKKLALAMAKKAEKSPNLSEEGFDAGGALFSGLVGGGTLAYYIAKAGDVLTDYQKFMGYSPSHMTAIVGGAIAGAILAVIAKYAWDKYKGD